MIFSTQLRVAIPNMDGYVCQLEILIWLPKQSHCIILPILLFTANEIIIR